MSFLFPLYLLGALAIGLPILLHLRRRPPKEHVPFSSHLFLEKTPERLTRRTRIERWLLLALRCLALLLLALAFGRPFFKSDSLDLGPAQGKRLIILVDNSASMRRGELWQKAIDRAAAEIQNSSPEDEVALGTVGETIEVLATFAAWNDLSPKAREQSAKELLDNQLTWETTNLGEALSTAAEMIEDTGDDPRNFESKQIVLISDFQEGATIESLNQYAWPETVAVRPRQLLLAEENDNLSLHLIAASDISDARRVRISNQQDSEKESFAIRWENSKEPMEELSGFLPPGTSRVLSVPPRDDSSAADATLLLTGDNHDFDNRVFIARAQPRKIQIRFLTSEPAENRAGTPLFYLKRAMHPTAALEPFVSESTFEEVGTLEETQAVVAHGPLSENMANDLAAFASNGGLVIAMPDASSSSSLSLLTGIDGLELAEAAVNDYAMLSSLDFEHPVLAPFARSGLRDFTKIYTWKHRSIKLPNEAEGVRILAKYDSGEPAWVEVRRGDGVIFLMMSGWEPRESQLALSSKFVPLIYSILGESGYSAITAAPLTVGDRLDDSSATLIKLPDGSETSPPVVIESPGFYTVVDTEGDERIFAANLGPSESRTAVTDPVISLGDLGVNVVTDEMEIEATAQAAAMTEKEKRRLESVEKEENQKLWKWLALTVLVILVIETWVAGRRRYLPASTPAT